MWLFYFHCVHCDGMHQLLRSIVIGQCDACCVLRAGSVSAEPLHPVRAAAARAPVYGAPDAAASRHVRLRLLAHRLPQDGLPRHHSSPPANQVSFPLPIR